VRLFSTNASNVDRIQGRLLLLAGAFLAIYSLGLTISPAVRLQSWNVTYRWDHWVAFFCWVTLFWLAHRQTSLRLPDRDPYLLPIVALLSGWGLLTIWRLSPGYGLRQSLWVIVSVVVLILGLRLPGDLRFLRRYKYLWLTGGLLLTALTLVFGTNPSGGQERLWLGFSSLYFQPSEPLKLLLIIYLAAYLADRLPEYAGLLPLLAPTLIMAGLAMALMIFQRDLGTTFIFLFLYATVIYLATGRKRVLILSGLAVLVAIVAGYGLYDVVRLRIDAWLNPWLDPSGRSYQIVQSLLAIANGGVIGRGPGLGSPGLVPVPHSDFIFSSIVEENGLLGGLGLLLLLGLLVNRGLRAALNAPDGFRRYLAAGLTAYLVGQSILIIGGNLRLLPLTGVTLPFVSYGGSSLLTSFISILLLLRLSAAGEASPAPLAHYPLYLHLGIFLQTGLAAAAILLGWWTVYRAPNLLTRTDNARRGIADRYAQRGAILDRSGEPISDSQGNPGSYIRISQYPDLAPVVGYNDPVYGQSGLEDSLDPYLRGLKGNPSSLVWWNELLYGLPPTGLDVRLTLDLNLQRIVDGKLGDLNSALVLMNASNGEILAMASHPTFDPGQLNQEWSRLVKDPRTPLLDRAAQGLYQPGPALGPFLLASASGLGDLPELPENLSYTYQGQVFSCALTSAQDTWQTAVADGCPGAVVALGTDLDKSGAKSRDALLALYKDLGLYSPPPVRLPASGSSVPQDNVDPAGAALGQADLMVSPLQMARAAAVLSSDGVLPVPHLVSAVNTPEAGWVILPNLSQPVRIFPAGIAVHTAESLVVTDMPVWQEVARAYSGENRWLTWYLAGTLPDWKGSPIVVALLIEEDNPSLAIQTGQAVLQAALSLNK
jgi:cell division protein FtsW (lipid II flippase)